MQYDEKNYPPNPSLSAIIGILKPIVIKECTEKEKALVSVYYMMASANNLNIFVWELNEKNKRQIIKSWLENNVEKKSILLLDSHKSF